LPFRRKQQLQQQQRWQHKVSTPLAEHCNMYPLCCWSAASATGACVMKQWQR
jgi:hypothetical protein